MFLKRILPLIVLIITSIVILMVSPSCSRTKVKPSILLVTIDTLRRDHVGIYGYPRQTSPFIDELAKKGTMFKNVVTPIPVTDGSHASILTSLHPLTHKVIINGTILSGSVQTIAEVLKTNGYYTIGTIAVNHMSRRYNFSQGFDSFSDDFRGFERDAGSVNKSLFKQIDEYLSKSGKNKKPFFIWLHYYDPHTPYIDRHFKFKAKIPERYYKMKPEKIVDLVNRYDNEIRYVDEALKEVFAYLREKHLEKNLVTCITADHGEQHGDHGWHSGHFDFYSENTLVPLIFHGYKIPKGKIIDTFVSTMDISVTLLKMAGLNFDYETEGNDLFDSKINIKNKEGERKFLIIGHPPHIKSLQLLRYPFSYILNFDRYYKAWYISPQNIIPEDKFKKIKPENIQINNRKKYIDVTINFPYAFRRGIHYAVLKVKLKESNVWKRIRIKFCYRLMTQLDTEEKMDTLTIVHPVNTLDRMIYTVKFVILPITKITSIEYAVLSKDEFQEYSGSLQKIKNDMFPKLWTRRRSSEKDELFDLVNDIEMNKNLFKDSKEKYPVDADIYNDQIYKLFEFYYKKGKTLFHHQKMIKPLSQEQKKMLKTLGYM
jgi:hypothetical protein